MMGVEFAPGAPGAPVSRWETYPDYRDSGVKWLGKIPVDWEVKKLKYTSHLDYGDSLPAEVREEGDIPVYGSNGIVGFHSNANTLAPVLIIGRKGSFGKVNYSEKPCFSIDTAYFIDLRNTQSNLWWLFYIFQLLNLDSLSQDSAIPGLSREFVYNQIVPNITLHEQRTIAAFLDRKTAHIDTLISKKERLITLLQEKRAALISHTVTKGLDSDVPMKDSGVEWLGEIPVHWKMARFRRICRVQQGLQIAQTNRFAEPKPNRFEYITIKSIHAGDASNLKEYIENPPKSVICTPDDILLARTGATGEVISGQNGVFHNNFFKIIWDQSQFGAQKTDQKYPVTLV
jgi:type I restriction enzyme S subunit